MYRNIISLIFVILLLLTTISLAYAKVSIYDKIPQHAKDIMIEKIDYNKISYLVTTEKVYKSFCESNKGCKPTELFAENNRRKIVD